MSEVTPLFNACLKKHGTHCSIHRYKASSTNDEFLKEAYRIATHISSLRTHLLSIRQAYLSTATAPPSHRHTKATSPSQQPLFLTNPARDAIDTNAKLLLRDLSSSLKQLSDVEGIRHTTWQRVQSKKYARGFLSRWAAGGSNVDDSDNNNGAAGKTPEQRAEEGQEETLSGVREGVLWYLGRKLEGVAEVQREMVERRVRREVERGRSVLYMAKTRGGGGGGGDVGEQSLNGSAGGEGRAGMNRERKSALTIQQEEEEEKRSRKAIEQQLSPEQLQLFAQENQDMLRHYEDTLDQVRTAEKSMLEISELQTQLVENLDLQSTHISQLVADSIDTTENVGGGNKQLKRATERKSTARMVFWASCGLCGVLVGWDLIF